MQINTAIKPSSSLVLRLQRSVLLNYVALAIGMQRPVSAMYFWPTTSSSLPRPLPRFTRHGGRSSCSLNGLSKIWRSSRLLVPVKMRSWHRYGLPCVFICFSPFSSSSQSYGKVRNKSYDYYSSICSKSEIWWRYWGVTHPAIHSSILIRWLCCES